MANFLESWNVLSSDGLVGWFVDTAEKAGVWAEATANLIGLL